MEVFTFSFANLCGSSESEFINLWGMMPNLSIYLSQICVGGTLCQKMTG